VEGSTLEKERSKRSRNLLRLDGDSNDHEVDVEPDDMSIIQHTQLWSLTIFLVHFSAICWLTVLKI